MEAGMLVKAIEALPPTIAVLIRGDHGIGKSQIARSVAADLKLEFIDVRASTMQEGDVVGYPDLDRIKETGVASFALPSWYVRACREPVVLMLDELNRGLPGVQNGFFQVILDRELGNGPDGRPIALHPGTRVIAAVNVGSEYTVTEMDPALLDRFWVVDFTPSVKDWTDWATKKGVDPGVVAFISQHPDYLRTPSGKVEPGKVVPTQRSWERLDASLKAAGCAPMDVAGKGDPMIFPIAAGFVGIDVAVALSKFVENMQAAITAEDVLDRWKDVAARVKALSNEGRLDLVNKLAAHSAAQNKWTKRQAEGMAEFFKLLDDEMMLVQTQALMAAKNNDNLITWYPLSKPLMKAALERRNAASAKDGADGKRSEGQKKA